jgi:hypothetical protein
MTPYQYQTVVRRLEQAVTAVGTAREALEEATGWLPEGHSTIAHAESADKRLIAASTALQSLLWAVFNEERE